MIPPRDDRDLHDAFAAQRREEAAAAPDFHRLLSAARRPSRVARTMLVPALGLVGALAIALVLREGPPRDAAQPVVLANPLEPTAFLLRTPGRELLSSAPAFGGELPGQN